MNKKTSVSLEGGADKKTHSCCIGVLLRVVMGAMVILMLLNAYALADRPLWVAGIYGHQDSRGGAFLGDDSVAKGSCKMPEATQVRIKPVGFTGVGSIGSVLKVEIVFDQPMLSESDNAPLLEIEYASGCWMPLKQINRSWEKKGRVFKGRVVLEKQSGQRCVQMRVRITGSKNSSGIVMSPFERDHFMPRAVLHAGDTNYLVTDKDVYSVSKGDIQVAVYYNMAPASSIIPEYCSWKKDDVCQAMARERVWGKVIGVRQCDSRPVCETMEGPMPEGWGLRCNTAQTFTPGTYELVLLKQWMERTPRLVWSDPQKPVNESRLIYKDEILGKVRIIIVP